MTSRRGLLVSTLGLLMLGGAAYAQIQPSRMNSGSAWDTQDSSKRNDSHWVTIGRSGAVVTPDGPELRLSMNNKKNEPLEVKVTFKMPGEDCVETKTLVPGGKAGFACQQTALLAEKAYPVTIEVFKQGKSRRVDRVRLSYRFGSADIARMEERIAKLRPGR